jgi:large subunit ribosomal protein L24
MSEKFMRNSKRIKKGDTVKIITGDDKGTVAKVIKVMPKDKMILVEGCKTVKKAVKPSDKNPDGGFVTKEMPINISNVTKVEEE